MMCESKMVSKSDDVDVGCGNAFGGGGEDDEGAGPADTKAMVNNVIDSFSYTETSIGSPNDLKSWLKEYFPAVREKLREKGKPKEYIQTFMGQASGIAKFLISNFSDLQFYLSASFNSETMVFSMYIGESTTPNFYYIMAGYEAEKF